jgi:hypothetical protein
MGDIPFVMNLLDAGDPAWASYRGGAHRQTLPCLPLAA